MPSTTCWNCGQVAHMTPIEGSASVVPKLLRDRVLGCFRCDGCMVPNIADDTGLLRDQEPLAWLAGRKKLDWRPLPPPPPPRPVSIKSFPDVPPVIAAAASEAYRCRTVSPSACRAAVLMARSVIEATAKEKGFKTGGLAQKIDKMHDAQLIRPHVRDGAHEIRYLGNDMAHGDFVQPIALEDADLVLALMSEVLEDVYQSPARVARAQARREEKKALEAARAVPAERNVLPTGGSAVAQAVMQAMIIQANLIEPD